MQRKPRGGGVTNNAYKELGARLQNKVALVTGAASGFGAEIARAFAAEGAFVAVVDLNEAGARGISSEIGNTALPIKCDVATAGDVRNAVETTHKIFGRLDIVVNNAGTTHRNKPMLEVTEAEFDKVYAVNVKSIYHMAHAAVPAMRAQGGGVFLNIGSTAGLRPRPGLTWYNGSKGAVNLLTKSMAVELAPDHIRVNGLAPVAGDTPLLPAFSEPIAGNTGKIPRNNPARPIREAVRRRRGGFVPLLGRRGVSDRCSHGGRRRPNDITRRGRNPGALV